MGGRKGESTQSRMLLAVVLTISHTARVTFRTFEPVKESVAAKGRKMKNQGRRKRVTETDRWTTTETQPQRFPRRLSLV